MQDRYFSIIKYLLYFYDFFCYVHYSLVYLSLLLLLNFFNMQKFHSIVLMAVADADYKFLYIDVGAYGSEGDGSVFYKTDFGESIVNNTIELPEDVLIGDRKVPFNKPRGRPFNDSENIFNYRLSRARRCVENAFGILAAKFVCLNHTLHCGPERAQRIVSACCILHNFLLNDRTTRNAYCPAGMADHYDENGVLIEGTWRAKSQNIVGLQNIPQTQMRPNEIAKKNREIFEQFFNSPEGSLPWQRRAVFLE